MGWWNLTEFGPGVDLSRTADNVVENGVELVMGDTPADYMDEAIEKIVKAYHDIWGRKPTVTELKACFEFCIGGYEEKE